MRLTAFCIKCDVGVPMSEYSLLCRMCYDDYMSSTSGLRADGEGNGD